MGATISSGSGGGEWTYIKSVSTATATLDITALPAYQSYKVYYQTTAAAPTLAAAGITVNGIAGTAYSQRTPPGGMNPEVTGQASWLFNSGFEGNSVNVFTIGGISAAQASGLITFTSFEGAYSLSGVGKCIVGNNVQITRITVVLTGAATQKADIYGYNMK